MKIRRALLSEAKEISKLQQETIKRVNAKYYAPKEVKVWVKSNGVNEVRSRIQDTSRIFVVALEKNKIVGILSANLTTGTLNFGYISHKHIGEGIGSKLFAYVEKYLAKRGLKRINGCATVNTVDFYRRKGYRIGKKGFYVAEGVKIPCVWIYKKVRV